MDFIVLRGLLFLLLTVMARSLVINDTNITHIMKINATRVRESETFSDINENSKLNKTKERYQNEVNIKETPTVTKPNFFPPDLYRLMLAVNRLSEGKCKNDSKFIMDAVVNHEKWALRMFDASPKFPVGMLYGSYYQLGNFDECILIKASLPQSERTVQGQYCLADITLESNDEGDERISRSSAEYYQYQRPSNRIELNNTLHWGICVPSSCSPEEVKQFLGAIFNIAISRRAIKIHVPELRCHYEKDIPFSALEIIYGSVIGIFAVFVLLATFFHVIKIYGKNTADYTISTQQNTSTKMYQEVILAFSLIRSIGKLLHTGASELSLECIFGIKFLSMLLIISSHSLLFLVSGPVLNEDFVTEAVQKPQNAILLNNPLLVDTFLLISGFLMCRLLLLELDKRKGKINIFILYLARYIRLTPSYLVVIFFYVTVFIRMDSGPLWDERMSIERDRCLKSWWTNILYINNYVNTDNICMFQSWFLSVDTHLFMIAPFIIYPLWKWPRRGEILLGIVTFIATIVPFIITYVYGLDPTLMAFPSEISDISKNPYYVFAYIKTHMRATSYCVGLVTGYIVYKLQSSNTKISNSVLWVSWILAIIFGITSIYSITVFYLPNHEYDVLESAAYSALHKIAWSFSIAWIIVACTTDNAGPIKRFLSWAPFVPLSRLAYCAYLVNGAIELHSFGILRSPVFLSVYHLASIVLSHFLLTFTAGFVLCVMFESPIHSIEKILLTQESKRRKRQEPQ